jgi:enamine deaminase RidA (YjgF/YER057c/UK114 family)
VSITRLGIGPRWSDIVIHAGTMYVVEVPSRLDGDIAAQAREVLLSLEDSLAQGGSDKQHLLSVTIYLDDIRDLDGFNTVWDAWVPRGHAPVRACVQARLGKPGYKVELQVTAAVITAGPA